MKQTFTVEWTRTRHTKNVHIAHERYNQEERNYYKLLHCLETLREQMAGSVEVSIDVDEIMRIFVTRAANSSSGKSTGLRGLIKARRLTEKILGSKTEAHPIPKGYVPIGSEVRS